MKHFILTLVVLVPSPPLAGTAPEETEPNISPISTPVLMKDYEYQGLVTHLRSGLQSKILTRVDGTVLYIGPVFRKMAEKDRNFMGNLLFTAYFPVPDKDVLLYRLTFLDPDTHKLYGFYNAKTGWLLLEE